MVELLFVRKHYMALLYFGYRLITRNDSNCYLKKSNKTQYGTWKFRF